MRTTQKIGKSLVTGVVLVVLLATAGLVFAAGNQAQEEGALWQLWDLTPANLDTGTAERTQDGELNTEEQPEHLFLWQKCPEGEPCPWFDSDEWGAAWGRLVYFCEDNPNNEFAFSGYGLDTGKDYTLIYYPDPWPGNGLICLGSGTTDDSGYITIKGEFNFGTIPLVDDDNYPGAKIWLVSSADVNYGTENKMTGWNPEEYLFENNLIEDDSEDLSYTMYHGNGIWSTTHIMREDDVKPDDVPAKAQTQGPACYKLMGVAWSTEENDFVVNPTGSDGLSNDFVKNTIVTSTATWDTEVAFAIFGDNSIDYEADWDWSDNPQPDGKNEFVFDNYPVSGVIAVTRTWWNFEGEIVEYDIMFDTDWSWGDADPEGDGTVDTSVMDFQNIATHEIGHGIGLLDLYNPPCSDVTMYGRSSYGDITKRDLEPQDIAGLQAIYGV